MNVIELGGLLTEYSGQAVEVYYNTNYTCCLFSGLRIIMGKLHSVRNISLILCGISIFFHHHNVFPQRLIYHVINANYTAVMYHMHQQPLLILKHPCPVWIQQLVLQARHLPQWQLCQLIIPQQCLCQHLLTIGTLLARRYLLTILVTDSWLEFDSLPSLLWGKVYLLCIVCLFMIWCTYTWCKCYCMSIWLAWLFLAWCSHDYCDIMDLVIVIYLWLTCTQLLYLVLWWTQRVPGIISYFECFCSCAIELFEL